MSPVTPGKVRDCRYIFFLVNWFAQFHTLFWPLSIVSSDHWPPSPDIHQSYHYSCCCSRFLAMDMNTVVLGTLCLHMSLAHPGIHIPDTCYLGLWTVVHPKTYSHSICSLSNVTNKFTWKKYIQSVKNKYNWPHGIFILTSKIDVLPGHVAQQWPGFFSGLEHDTDGHTMGVHWTVPSYAQVRVLEISIFYNLSNTLRIIHNNISL